MRNCHASVFALPRAFPGFGNRFPAPVEGMTPELCNRLRDHMHSKYGLQSSAAEAWGVASAFVTKVLLGRALPTPVMLADAGLTVGPADIARKN